MKRLFLFLSFSVLLNISFAQKPKVYDICVYGGTSAGVIAAYTAKKLGKTVILIEPSNHIGGLSSGGLGQTDIGNKYAISGISRQFYRKIGQNYGRFEQWIFEPKVAKSIFMDYLKPVDLVLTNHELLDVIKIKGSVESIWIKNTQSKTKIKITAKYFIDCSYEGDLMVKSGVSYTIGREANSKYGETWNGVQMLDKHQFPDGIDPFIVPGDSASGLLWGISTEKLAATGLGDKKVQAYNFRMCLTDSIENQIPISKPIDYDSEKYELLLRYIEKKQPLELNWALMHLQPMPHRKLDINNSGPFSTNLIGANYAYPDASYSERKQIQKAHANHIKGFFYFLGNDSRVPEHLRKEMKKWGYPKDEYIDNEHFSPQMYIREARRMVSDLVMTENHCVGKETVSDGIGLAAYTMDSHNTQRIIIKDSTGKYQVKNEGDVQKGLGGLDPYPISYRAIVPKKTECTNLLVPVCLSASHIAFGSIRMEPVFMVLAQSAATAACLALDSKKAIQDIDIKKLQESLKENPYSDNSKPEILIDNADKNQFSVEGYFELINKGYGRYGKDFVKLPPNSTGIFSTKIKSPGKYTLQIYFPKAEGMTETAEIEILIGRKQVKKILNLEKEENDWYNLGQFEIAKNQEVEVTIKSKSNSFLIADALLWVPN
ncbi:FAD-dependent oxidoreductase [Lacihabitans sp. LS3-19]|uniref:FAD-dependent oxidoreductase n=1 Tax=Lacihabitans sp. LS3-19 TaxID=2487335 RepID=UPI0020CECBF6|nr:FAD-dependent oxidoreductase [Lacihabitans sp. LS3-19]MCP9766463.1 FAD-dependent oxidoreductase [Lacihabitans sp. LS3-19]